MENKRTLPQAEAWKPVVGYEEIFEVSDLGRVRRIKCGKGTRIGRVLAGVLNNGYRRVTLWKSKSVRAFYVHQLVARSFLGLPRGRCVNHKDGQKLNNALSNLEYVTVAENNHHAARTGLSARGEMFKSTRLTEADVRAIRRLYPGVQQEELARKYGVNRSTIGFVVRGDTWKHVK